MAVSRKIDALSSLFDVTTTAAAALIPAASDAAAAAAAVVVVIAALRFEGSLSDVLVLSMLRISSRLMTN